ncbi:MAG: hypothetical protein Q4A29_10555 [Eubacteriales bacterium]|nr:hypothetical protein [Eubacteriales bacterium]
MAIDGVMIIDSDSGYDIYNDITERYKDGEDIEKIKQDWIKEAENFCIDELYAEIYWTAFAYSLWKVGYPKDEVREKALKIIEDGASALWDEIDDKARKQRQKALDRLALQLQTDNPKPLKKPIIRKPKEPYFQTGDVLAVKMEQGYGICFVSKVDQSPRKVEYHLACTGYLSDKAPTMQDFLESEIVCGKFGQDYALKTDCWFNHKELGNLLPDFQKLGQVRLEPYRLFVLSPARSLNDIYKEIMDFREYSGTNIKSVLELVAEVAGSEE